MTTTVDSGVVIVVSVRQVDELEVVDGERARAGHVNKALGQAVEGGEGVRAVQHWGQEGVRNGEWIKERREKKKEKENENERKGMWRI